MHGIWLDIFTKSVTLLSQFLSYYCLYDRTNCPNLFVLSLSAHTIVSYHCLYVRTYCLENVCLLMSVHSIVSYHCLYDRTYCPNLSVQSLSALTFVSYHCLYVRTYCPILWLSEKRLFYYCQYLSVIGGRILFNWYLVSFTLTISLIISIIYRISHTMTSSATFMNSKWKCFSSTGLNALHLRTKPSGQLCSCKLNKDFYFDFL